MAEVFGWAGLAAAATLIVVLFMCLRRRTTRRFLQEVLQHSEEQRDQEIAAVLGNPAFGEYQKYMMGLDFVDIFL